MGEPVIEVDEHGVARIIAANDASARVAQRVETARSTSTPAGLFAFLRDNGDKEAARRLHDAMFGPGAASETPSDTPVGATARAWKKP